MKNSRRKVSKAGKKKPGEGEDGSSIDRLSNLPEAVIHHILSFLDTRSAVQTSVLSRQWKCAWKHLSVLDFRGRWPRSFERYVETVLSLRYQLNLSKVIFSDHLDTEPSENSLFARVSRYALSHGTQHLEIHLDCTSPEEYPSADLLGFNCDYSLKTLELSCFSFSSRFRYSSFLVLGKLDLNGCAFLADQDEVVDPFSNLPCLKHLVLDNVFNMGNHDVRFRISGLQLLSFRLIYSDFRKMEIYAPKLKNFTFEYNDNYLVEFTELTLPSLDHADIQNAYVEEHRLHLIHLFHGLSNATSLALCSYTAQMLGEMSGYLDNQPSPFTRLKFLTMAPPYACDDVPFAVLNYLLKGSLNTNPVVKFRS